MAHCKKIPNHFTTILKVIGSCQRKIPRNKVPNSCRFELTTTFVAPNKMILWQTTLLFQITPMQHENML
jgi:hypothetical protein